MARTIDEIKQAMLDQQATETSLSGLTSTSSTALYDNLYFVCATSQKVTEDLYDVLEDDVEERKLEIPTGVLPWYADESLLFQNGDTLVFQNTYVDENGDTVTLKGKNLVYDPVITANRIVDLAAADIVNGVIVIKAAKVTSGVAEKLTAGELAAFTAYWLEKRFAGSAITIVSNDPDLMICGYSITYDPQILLSTGESIVSPGTFPINDAIDSFLAQFQIQGGFDGVMQVMKLTDSIQAVSGVKNAVATDVQGKPDGGTYIDILATTEQKYTANAGYMKIDPTNPLSGTLTYIAG